jgi:hypothetical protein
MTATIEHSVLGTLHLSIKLEANDMWMIRYREDQGAETESKPYLPVYFETEAQAEKQLKRVIESAKKDAKIVTTKKPLIKQEAKEEQDTAEEALPTMDISKYGTEEE